MRLNQFIATNSLYSRREADELIAQGRVTVNGQTARLGQPIDQADTVALDGQALEVTVPVYVVLHKPAGYVCSRRGQGAPTIYELLPPEYKKLKTVGRLDKDTSGLILLTNDGVFAHELTHPSFQKEKTYEVELDKPLSADDLAQINQGIKLPDGMSRLRVRPNGQKLTVTMSEGRNRQIRRTFAALGYDVAKLHRTAFGAFKLNRLQPGEYAETVKP